MFNVFFSVLEPAITQKTTTVPKVKKELKDIGRVATEAFSIYPESTIDKAFQGSNDTSPSDCYSSEDDDDAYAHIKLEPSEVSEVAFLADKGAGEYRRQIIENYSKRNTQHSNNESLLQSNYYVR